MREIPVSRITDVVERLCIEANTHLPGDVKCAIEACRACEDGDIAVGVLDKIIENYDIADARNVFPSARTPAWPACFWRSARTSTSPADLREAVDEGVRRGYTEGLSAQDRWCATRWTGCNTGDNTPAMLYVRAGARRAGRRSPWPPRASAART